MVEEDMVIEGDVALHQHIAEHTVDAIGATKNGL
jgi:hypothetical protein